MYCPKCSQLQGSEQTRFCSRCGFALDGVRELVAHEGSLTLTEPEAREQRALSERQAGVRQGAKIALLGAVLLPLGYGLCFVFHSSIPALLPFTVFLAGLAWMLYSRVFGEQPLPPAGSRLAPSEPPLGAHLSPPSAVAAQLKDAGTRGFDASEPARTPSVTEHTTELLDSK